MKKFLMRLTLFVTALITAFAFTACGEKQRPEDQLLEVYSINSGYRVEGVKAILNSFAEQDWVKEKYPELEIKLTDNQMASYALDKIKNPKTNEFDLFFTGQDLTSVFEKNSSGKNLLVDITESVYNAEVIDESGVKFSDKMHPSYLDFYAYTTKTNTTPRFFEVPWVTGMHGILYNEEILAEYGYTDGKYPNTTDEFLELCDKIKKDPSKSGNPDGYALMNCDSAYSSYLLDTWWAQYDGIEAYRNFWQGKYKDARGTSYSNRIFSLQGRRKALDVMYEMFSYRDGKSYYDLKGQNNDDYMVRQTNILKGSCAFTYCSDWFDTEMEATRKLIIADGQTPATIKIMKMPIVSALTDKLDTVKTDELLSKVVSAIDGGETTYMGVSQDDFDRIAEARGIYKSGGMNHVAVIPTSSNSQKIAIDVLRFMGTDVCQEAYMKATRGQNLPFDYTVDAESDLYKNDLSELQKSRLPYFYSDGISVLPFSSRYPLVRYSNFKAISTQSSKYNEQFGIQNTTVTPQKLFEDTEKAWTEDAFNFALLTAGLK